MRKRLFKATGMVFLLSLIAKIIGFSKSMIEASYYGASFEMDAYNVSNGFVSNVLYMLTTAIAVAFLPLYIQHSTKENKRKKFATRSITALCLLSLLLTILLLLSAPVIVRVIAPSFDFDQRELAAKYFRILALGIVFSLAANMFTSVLNSEKRFGFAALSSIINSIVLICFIIALSSQIGVWALVIAMPVSFFAQWIILYCIGKKYAYISLRYGLHDESIKLLVLQAMPILLSQATVEINQVVDRALLSGIETGALTAVSYSAVLYQFVTALISTPVSTVMFTELSEAGAAHDLNTMKSLLLDSFKLLIFVCIPIIIITVFCANDIVSFVYGHGRFGSSAIRQCTEGLSMYILCLLPSSIKSVLSRAYYGLNDTKRPMIFGIIEVILNIGLSVLLVKRFAIWGVVGATAISSFAFVIIMILNFNRIYIKTVELKNIISCWKVGIGTICILVLLYILKRTVQFAPLLNFAINTVAAFSVYFGILILLKDGSMKYLLSHLRQLFKKS